MRVDFNTSEVEEEELDEEEEEELEGERFAGPP
jgi:hypothetical protein